MTRDGWREYPLGAFMTRLTRKNAELNENVLTISAEHGLVGQEEFFNKRIASKNLSNYFLLEQGEFVYSKSSTKDYPVGAIKRLDAHEKGVVSPLYICFALTDLTVITSDYIAHLFESGALDGQIRLIAREGGRAHGLLNVKPSEFFEVVADLPSLPEQCKIAAILSSVDDAIEKTQAVIDQVQVVKRGLMQELLTRGLPGRHTRFKQTEIGEFPSEWTVAALGDCASIGNGTTPSKKRSEYWDDGTISWLPTGKVNDRTICSADVRVTERAVSETSLRVLPVGTLLIAMIGQGKTRGKTAYLDIEACVNQNFAYIVSARKPPFRAEICANSWHSGGDVGANPVATKAPDGLRASVGQYVARMSCFKGQ